MLTAQTDVKATNKVQGFYTLPKRPDDPPPTQNEKEGTMTPIRHRE